MLNANVQHINRIAATHPVIMKDAIVHTSLQVEIVDSPIPHPGADQLVIKVVVSGSNPKDWYGCPTRRVFVA